MGGFPRMTATCASARLENHLTALSTTATRSTRAAWTRRATCTSTGSILSPKETAIPACAIMGPLVHAPGWDV